MLTQYNSSLLDIIKYKGTDLTELQLNGITVWSGYLEYTELDDGTYSVSSRNGATPPSNIVIPGSYNGGKVTQIENAAFSGAMITSVYISSSIRIIGSAAFYGCTNLKMINESGKNYIWAGEIGDNAFHNCNNLGFVILTPSTKKIGSGALTNATIDVFFEGDEKAWAKIENSDTGLDNLVYFYSEEEPTTTGRYWHYTGTHGTPTKWDSDCANGHDYRSIVTPPTCTEQGYTTYICRTCGNTYTHNYVDALGHTWAKATCTTPKTCSVCGATEGETLAHDFGEWYKTIEPTCGKQGYTEHTCTRCHYSYKDNYVDATGQHHYGTIIVKPPTCEDDGYTFYQCTECNHSYSDNFTDALGHIESDWIIDEYPNFIMEGKKHKECVRCGEILETATIPKITTYWDFTLLDDGTYSVKPLEDVQLPANIDIPSEHLGVPVTRIANSAFEGYWGNILGTIIAVNIPSSITHIGDYAFQDCRGLIEITIPIGVTYVGRQAFYECGITIYCEAPSQPSGWHSEWSDSAGDNDNTVVWNSRCIDGHNIVDGICTRCNNGKKGVVYYGVSAIPESYNTSFILGLEHKTPSDTHLNSISVTPLDDEYIYYCAPTSFGDCAFAYNNLVGGFSLIIEGISFTNAGGRTESYNIYKSNQANLGVNGEITITIEGKE